MSSSDIVSMLEGKERVDYTETTTANPALCGWLPGSFALVTCFCLKSNADHLGERVRGIKAVTPNYTFLLF